MAENNGTTVTVTNGTSTAGDNNTLGTATVPKTDDPKPDKNGAQNPKDTTPEPSIEELTLQLAKANAENAKFKNSINKLSSENAELNRWKKERMSVAEKQAEEEAEAKAQMMDHIKELETYKAVNEASKRYIEMGMNVELATATASAEVNGEMDVVMRNIKQNQEDLMKAQKAEWLKSRPDILAGGDGKTVTREDFDKMSLRERTVLRRTDPSTYDQLLGKK